MSTETGNGRVKPIVIFGNGRVASLAHFYLTHDSPHEVAAFTVDRDYMTNEQLFGLPIVPVEEIVDRYPPAEFDMFVAVGYGRINKFRESKYHQVKELGYSLINYVSSKAVVWPDALSGDNCFIMEANIVQPFATLGSDIIMWSGCHIGHETIVGDHCFFSSHTVISGYVQIEPNCFFGVNSTIRDGVTIARESVIGAGALIMKDTKERGIYTTPPAQLLPLTSDRLPGI